MPLRNILFKYRVLLLHVSFWVLYFSYRVYDVNEYLGFTRGALFTALPMSFNIVASYIHYLFILPILFRDKKWGKYFLFLILLLTVSIVLRILTENNVFPALTKNETYYQTVKLTRIVSTVWDTLSFLLFTGMIRFVLDWFELENKRKQLENEKLTAELNYLKSQINPHFLFNTLHNLNSLVYAGAKNANEVIIKLSNIMRYMIYESGKERVALSSEIEYMNDYIHLESIRLNNSFKLDFTITGPVEKINIAPLMLITFLENAFKHGVSDQEPDCWIDVKLSVDSRQLTYRVSNKKIRNVKQNKLKSGFGLDNVKKRLELSYPDKYALVVDDREDTYSINLTLQLV
jgi:LytS/YehU family sensor histidine kinase